jgi:allantoin racemase
MGKKRILYIDTVGEKPEEQAGIKEYLNKHLSEDCEPIEVTSLGNAPLNMEYFTYLAFAGPEIVRIVRQAENKGYDASIIGCFCDPALDAAKEACDRMVVVGVMEAAVHLASYLAPKFSIIAARWKSVADFQVNLDKYGLSNRLASFRSLDVRVEDLQSDCNATHDRMSQEIKIAIEKDAAEAIILGCTLQMGHYTELQKEFGVPVIDVQLAGLLLAEQLIDARDKFGWYTSKICSYITPPKGVLTSMGLADKYGFDDF